MAQTAGMREHSLIAGNIHATLWLALRAQRGEVHRSDLRVKSATTDTYVYPDVSVVCGVPRFEDERRDTLLNPWCSAPAIGWCCRRSSASSPSTSCT